MAVEAGEKQLRAEELLVAAVLGVPKGVREALQGELFAMGL